jgi:hypothetical protein
VTPAKQAVTQQARSQPKKTPTSRKERTDIARSAPAPAPAPPPVLPQTTSTPKEMKPSVGTNNVLGRDEIRYCLSESIRMGAMKKEVNLYEEAEVDHFNATVQDYNNRCGQFRYRQGSLESVRREVESERTRLENAGILRIKKLREHSSSTTNIERTVREPKQASIIHQNEFPGNQSEQDVGSSSPSIDKLTQAERSSIESACNSDRLFNGPAAYNRCLQGQLARIRR